MMTRRRAHDDDNDEYTPRAPRKLTTTVTTTTTSKKTTIDLSSDDDDEEPFIRTRYSKRAKLVKDEEEEVEEEGEEEEEEEGEGEGEGGGEGGGEEEEEDIRCEQTPQRPTRRSSHTTYADDDVEIEDDIEDDDDDSIDDEDFVVADGEGEEEDEDEEEEDEDEEEEEDAIEDDDMSNEEVRKQVYEACRHRPTMDQSISYDNFKRQIWSSSFHSMMQSAFYQQFLRTRIHLFVKNRGNGSIREVALFHKQFLNVMEGGEDHQERVEVAIFKNRPQKGVCSCCNMPRTIVSLWNVRVGRVPYIWTFGSICEEALLKAVAVYNAFRWIERPQEADPSGEDDGRNGEHRGFANMISRLGVSDYRLQANEDTKTRAYARFRKILTNMCVDNAFGKRK